MCSILALASLVFFIIACAGYSNSKDELRVVPWIIGSYSGVLGDGNIYIGLRSYYNSGAVSEAKADFGDKNCALSFCDECQRDGDAALGLLIIALFATFFETCLCCAFTTATSAATQWIQMGISLFAAVFSMVAVILFGECYDAIDNSSGFDLQWSTGAILAILGVLLMWIVTFAHIVGAIYPDQHSGISI